MILPPNIADILETLDQADFEAYLVGGCVRDTLLGRQPSDYDIATSALPEQTSRIFPKTVPTGLKYGTVTVLHGGGKAEVTTFRSHEQYEDARRPSALQFGGDLRGDLARRDFTVNAMGYHPRRGLIDPFGGQADLAKSLIRAVGDPQERFREDALRILRAFRFAARLDFAIEAKTLEAAKWHMPLCAQLSGERIRAELHHILLSDRPSVLFSAVDFGLLDAHGVAHGASEGRERLDAVFASPQSRWAAFLAIASCDSEKLFQTLKFDNETKKNTGLLLQALKAAPALTLADSKRRLAVLGPALYEESLKLDQVLNARDISQELFLLRRIVESREPYRLDMLAVNGSDLIQAGITPGPIQGQMLRQMLDMVIDDPGMNRKEILLNQIKEIIN